MTSDVKSWCLCGKETTPEEMEKMRMAFEASEEYQEWKKNQQSDNSK